MATAHLPAGEVRRRDGSATCQPRALRNAVWSLFDDATYVFSVVPGLNAGTLVFLSLIFSPVCGLRASRAARSRFSNEPNPGRVTFSPLATVSLLMFRTLLSDCSAYRRDHPVWLTISSTNSDLFT
jgi:hypothetical protein